MEKNLKLVLKEEAKELLIEKGTSLEYGARPLRRAIEQLLEDPLAEDVLRGTFNGRDTINVTVILDDKGEKKLAFEGSGNVEPPAELVGAGAEKGGGVTKGENWSVAEGGK